MSEYTTIYDAIEADDVEGVCHFLNIASDLIDEGFWNPLHAASKGGNSAILQKILEYIQTTTYPEFDINSDFEIIDHTSDYRGTALSEALFHGEPEIAKILVENGADVNATYYNQNQNTPEYFFSEFDLSIDDGVCWWLANKELIQTMMNHGLEVDADNHAGDTALSLAVSMGDVERVNLLLEMGANPDQYLNHEDMGEIPILISAIMLKHIEVIKSLLKYGASLNTTCKDCDNETVIDIVIDQNNSQLDKIFGLKNLRNKINSH